MQGLRNVFGRMTHTYQSKAYFNLKDNYKKQPEQEVS
jgi:hypothetical protein